MLPYSLLDPVLSLQTNILGFIIWSHLILFIIVISPMTLQHECQFQRGSSPKSSTNLTLHSHFYVFAYFCPYHFSYKLEYLLPVSKSNYIIYKK